MPLSRGFYKKGTLIISPNISTLYQNISKEEIDLVGNDPFATTDPGLELASHDMIIKGMVIGVDTMECDPTNCQIVPKFKVESWSTSIYYPRFWTSGQIFIYIFLLAGLFSLLTIAVYIGWKLYKLIKSTANK